jgi:hypothetical protein
MRKVLAVTTALLIVVLLHSSWVFYSRWSETRDARRRASERESNDARRVVSAYGGDRLTVLHFTVTPAVARPGEIATLCYGVSNAKSVRIEPPVENVWPSLSRCVEVKSRRDTLYKLIAEDANGHTETATVPLKVR